MTSTKENSNEIVDLKKEKVLQPNAAVRIPQYRRDLFPSNIVLSAKDLSDFCELLNEANERAKDIEFNNLDLTQFESETEAKDRINEFIPLEYEYNAKNGDSVKGLGIPKTDERLFPDELDSFFISNATYTSRAINTRPLNTVEVFFDFKKPSLKIDLQTMPSNPTENRSVINISGRDENWVISTAEKIRQFFSRRKVFRPAIHSSGTFDYFVYLAFIPAGIWLLYAKGTPFNEWIEDKPIFLNVIVGIYLLLLSLLFARFVFQYFRWLFPPVEYYKNSRVGAYIHRAVAGFLASGLLLSATYDAVKSMLISIFS